MPLETIVQVSITLSSAAGLTRRGFGLGMLLSNEANTIAGFTERARAYASTAEMTADGFAAQGAAVQMATRYFGQEQKPPQLIVGRRENLTDQSVLCTVAQVLDDTNYVVTIGQFGTPAAFQIDSGTSATNLTIAAALVAAINAPAWAVSTAYVVGNHVANGGNVYRCTTAGTSAASGGPSGTGSGIQDGTVVWAFVGAEQAVTAVDNLDGTFTLNADNAGEIFDLQMDRQFITQDDLTADPGVVADLQAVRTDISGSDAWYVLISDNPATAETVALAAEIQSIERLFIAASADDDILTTSTTDLGSTLNGQSYTRTALLFHTKPGEFPHAAWAGGILPDDPGENTWNLKTLLGIDTDKFTTTETNNMINKQVNRYVEIAGLGSTQEGHVASGEWIDVIRSADSLAAGIREDVFAALKASKKVPFTNDGLAIINTAIRGVLQGATPVILSPDEPFSVQIPDVTQITDANKQARIAAPITFSGVLTGAIHKAVIDGTLTP